MSIVVDPESHQQRWVVHFPLCLEDVSFAGVSDLLMLDLLLLLQEIARETAVAEVAKLTQDMDEVLVVAVEKDETIEKLKDELSAARQQLLQKEAEEEAEAEEKSERPWLGP